MLMLLVLGPQTVRLPWEVFSVQTKARQSPVETRDLEEKC